MKDGLAFIKNVYDGLWKFNVAIDDEGGHGGDQLRGVQRGDRADVIIRSAYAIETTRSGRLQAGTHKGELLIGFSTIP